ncbi:MAG: patatin-like phospholipase family protein [Anaerolineae bacterium]|nr:patatin-like phospholipase family protein [Anaerolineae bacterium]
MQYDLVFEGGGAKGMVFVGAMQTFEAQGHTYGRLLGASAGAITATLLAAGYTAQEMLAALDEQKDGRPVFASFMGTPDPFDAATLHGGVIHSLLQNLDVPLLPDRVEDKLDDSLIKLLAKQPRFSHLFSFVERGGWFSADPFIVWMTSKLDSGTYHGAPRNFSGMTLAQFYTATQTDLTLVASDIMGERLLVLNHRTAPDCPLVWAVRMSMNIPLVWQEVIWQAGWGTYCGKVLAGHAIVDGGVLSNFPMELFVSSLPSVTNVMGPKTSDRVLGFLIDEAMAIPGAPEKPGQAATGFSFASLQPVQRILGLINTMSQAHDKMVIEAFARFVIRLPAQGYGTTEFDMSVERREALVAAGKRTTQAYFAAREAELLSPDLDFAAGPAFDAVRVADQIATRLVGWESEQLPK